jgi:hypothetical protein
VMQSTKFEFVLNLKTAKAPYHNDAVLLRGQAARRGAKKDR